jgi:hypothetical protein
MSSLGHNKPMSLEHSSLLLPLNVLELPLQLEESMQ